MSASFCRRHGGRSPSSSMPGPRSRSDLRREDTEYSFALRGSPASAVRAFGRLGASARDDENSCTRPACHRENIRTARGLRSRRRKQLHSSCLPPGKHPDGSGPPLETTKTVELVPACLPRKHMYGSSTSHHAKSTTRAS